MAIGLALALIFNAATANAQVRWQSGPSATPDKTPAEARAALAAFSMRSNARHVVIQFAQAVTPNQRAALGKAGLTLLNYLGDHAYFASTPAKGALDPNALAAVPTLIDARAIQREWKLDPRIPAGNYPDFAIGVDPDTNVVLAAAYIVFHRDVVLDGAGADIVRRHGAAIVGRMASINSLVIELPRANL
ncbi:MAG: hypothetical protein V3T70_07880, partial [Phycisphaerae bacterium]